MRELTTGGDYKNFQSRFSNQSCPTQMKNSGIIPASHVAFLRVTEEGQETHRHMFLFAVVRSYLPESFPRGQGDSK